MPDAVRLEVDYTLAMEAGLDHASGVTDAEVDAEVAPFARSHARLLGRVRAGELGFWNLPRDARGLEELQRVGGAFARNARDVLVLGIGGSSLGARALCEALAGDDDRPAPTTPSRVHFVDNSDPWRLSSLLARLDRSTTGVLAVSKSGHTLETTAQLLVVRAWLGEALDAPAIRDHVLAVTDPGRGPLRELATRERWASLAIPDNVGGRFSVLTPAGLLPALLAGVDVAELLEGAAAMATRCDNSELRANPAGMLATLHVLHHRKRGRSVHVMMPYADRLRAFAAWYVQLWAESLGKRRALDGRLVESGPTPVPAVGATDQHAQLQLFIEGPRDKLVTFVAVDQHERDLSIPVGTEPAHLAGKTLSELLRTQHDATREALAADGRPSITVRIERVDARHLGALVFLYEATTAFAGAAYEVDAFDQPGVELGKRLTDGLLGRAGAEDALAELARARAKRPDRYRA